MNQSDIADIYFIPRSNNSIQILCKYTTITDQTVVCNRSLNEFRTKITQNIPYCRIKLEMSNRKDNWKIAQIFGN